MLQLFLLSEHLLLQLLTRLLHLEQLLLLLMDLAVINGGLRRALHRWLLVLHRNRNSHHRHDRGGRDGLTRQMGDV